MVDKKECKIVEDLLPNYVEKLTNEETNIFIEEHLKKCSECNNKYENMKKDLNLDTNKYNRKDIKYLKKYKNKFMFLKVLIFTIVIIFALVIGRKIIIISDLSNKANEISTSSNFYRTMSSYGNDVYSKVEIYKMNDKYKMVQTNIKDEQISKTIIYAEKIGLDENGYDKYNTNIYTQTEGEKTARLNKELTININLANVFDIENNWQLFLYCIPTTVKSTTYNGEECYYISNFRNPYSSTSEGMYISKNTGLLISALSYEIENGDTGNIERWPGAEYKYEFNVVTEDDFIEPNQEEYEIKM